MNIGNVLITGANGFLGREIVSSLLNEGFNICATDMGPVSATAGVEYKIADITRPDELKYAIDNVDILIHAAGLAHIFRPSKDSEEQFRQINEIGTENVAKASAQAGLRHFILISSVSVYGPYTYGVYDEKRPCAPVGTYATSKHGSELRAADIARQSKGMALTILRFATLYGEGDRGNIKRLIRSIDRGRFIWIGDGRNRKSLLYKGDAAKACKIVALEPASGVNVFNVSGPPCTMGEIVDVLSGALGKRPLPGRIPASWGLGLSNIFSRLPLKSVKGINETVKKWLAEDVYDTRLFENTYGFRPSVGIEKGLRREVEWYHANC